MITVTLPKWLARTENLPLIAEGEVKAETERGIYFVGEALVRPSIFCLRCGRELTNPISRVVGIGPECCEKWGIQRPDYEDAVVLEKLIREKTHFERWLPKSQIKIEGVYTVAREPDPSPTLTLEGETLVLKCSYADRELAKQTPGYQWDGIRKCWLFPNEPWVVVSIKESFGERLLVQPSLLVDQVEPGNGDPIELNGHDTLYDFQKDGVRFLLGTKRALLADDMGLGKTVQTIAALDTLRPKKVLVIVPNAHKKGWKKEFTKWAPELQVEVVDGSKEQRTAQLLGDAQILIIHWEGARILASVIDTVKWSLIVCDEAHKMKNRASQTTKFLKGVIKKTPLVYFLTGTPVLNRPDELWPLLNMLSPRQFSSYWRFVSHFCELTHTQWGTIVGPVLEYRKMELREILGSLMLRRTKGEVLKDMPAKTVQKLYVELAGEQLATYKSMAKDMYARLQSGEEVSAAVVIAQIMRLKQICIDPEVMVEHNDQPLAGAKVAALLDILEEAGDQKVVVFSQFVRVLKALARRLELTPYKDFVLYTGEQNDRERQRNLEKFQEDPSCRLILVSTSAGGQGITLTAGSIAVFLDKLWTPAMNTQAQDRLHRIGQTKPVTIIELMAERTVEDKIEALLDQKKKIFRDLFAMDGEDTVAAKFTREELTNLFRYEEAV